jgi:hypothetical protein
VGFAWVGFVGFDRRRRLPAQLRPGIQTELPLDALLMAFNYLHAHAKRLSHLTRKLVPTNWKTCHSRALVSNRGIDPQCQNACVFA